MVTGPLERAENLAHALAAGDVTHRVDIGAADEVGRLSVALNSMAIRLAEVLGGVRRVADAVADGSRELAESFARQVAGTLGSYDALAAMLREGLAQAEDPAASGPLDAQDAAEFLEPVDDLQWLSRAMPFVEARVGEDFPGGVGLLRSRFEALTPLKAAAAASAGAKPPGKARGRRGATRQGFEFTPTSIRG